MSGACPSPHECLPEEAVELTEEEDTPNPDGYPDWNAETSFIISGPLPGWKGRGRVFTREEARRWVNRTYRVVFPIPPKLTPGRWAYRVLRPTAPGGRYTPPGERSNGV